MLTIVGLAVGFLLTLALLAASAARADTLVDAFVANPLTGIAIDGYDPVSYFTEAEPAEGKSDFEFIWGGVSWYFVNAANRDVFLRAPETYAPQYGGHCVMSLARGYLSDGKPRLFLIDHGKLYLFYSTANRDAFLLSKTQALATASALWPELAKQLSGVMRPKPVLIPVMPPAETSPPAEAEPEPDVTDPGPPGLGPAP